MGHFYCLCVLILHTSPSPLSLLPAAEPQSTVQSSPGTPNAHTALSMGISHSPGWVPRLVLMPWTAPTQNFFLENQKQQTPCLKFWNVWFKAFTEAQIVTGITQTLSPRRCQEHSLNLGRSFSVTNTKANKKQIQRVFRYALKTTLVKHFRSMWKLIFWGVSRDSLRSSSGKQTKAWTLVRVRFFCTYRSISELGKQPSDDA